MPSVAKQPKSTAKPKSADAESAPFKGTAPILAGSGTVDLDTVAFGAQFNMAIVHETVRSDQAARRRGTHATKTRGNVRGGGAKPWKQKGTGRARAGSSRSPIWTGGGTVFGPQPRSYVFKVNRKARRVALRSVLSLHAQRGTLAVFDAAAFDKPASKQAAKLLFDWDPARPETSTLVLVAETEREAGLSFRNLARVVILPVEDAAVANIIGAARLLVSQAALPALVARANGTALEDTAQEEADN